MRGGLTRTTVVASAVLALLVGTAFAILVRAVANERESAELATRSLEVIVAASGLERLVIDLETGQRGYLVTGEERFLQPWDEARRSYRRTADVLVARTGGVNGQAAAAREIADAVDAYVAQYSVPLVEAARRGAPSARSAAALDEGKRRVDALRAQFTAFIEAERRRFLAREEAADSDSGRAIVLAAVGLAGSTLLIVLFGGYLLRTIALPVRRAAVMSGRLAGGDLSTRMPETGAGEMGALERAFNTMAGSLEASRDELRSIADEQAALRRVATLVARDVPSLELVHAAVTEVRTLFGADATRLLRYDGDNSIHVVAESSEFGLATRQGESFTLEGTSVAAIVVRTGVPARLDEGLRASAGAPILVGARLWGVMVASWRRKEALSPGIEDRLGQFTELVATAFANAQSRADLAASRTRVVATADETRRRIERDLHDGAQQSLVHTVITLKLAKRALGDANDPAAELVDDALEHAEQANDDLRELAHGILPATLTRGLDAAIETLVSRVRLPVSVFVTKERLPLEVEATAYFIVAEALTNSLKHARASRAEVTVALEDGELRVEVGDDGVGGADTDGGSGLLGLFDRVAAMDGELRVDSPPGGGTTIAAALPVLQPS